jgi:hypothetical protein
MSNPHDFQGTDDRKAIKSTPVGLGNGRVSLKQNPGSTASVAADDARSIFSVPYCCHTAERNS